MARQGLALPQGTPDAKFNAVAAWARHLTADYVSRDELSLPDSAVARQLINVVTRNINIERLATQTAQQVNAQNRAATRSVIRSVFENSGTETPIQMRAPQVFTASTSTTAMFIGAGGIGGGVIEGAAMVETFGIGAADGAFFFGRADTPGKQISFDAGTGVLAFGSDIKVLTVNQTLATIASNASAGSAAYVALSGKIDKNAAYVLGASSEFKTSGYDGGNGTNFTNNGIVAKKAGVNTFVLANDGTATFAGALSAATGSFAGALDVAGDIDIKNGATSYGALQANGTLNACTLTAATSNVLIKAGGVYKVFATGSSGSIGLIGDGIISLERDDGKYLRITSTGIFFNETPKVATTPVSLDGHTHSGYALSSHTHASLTNGGSIYTFSGGLISGGSTATFTSTNKPGSSSSNGWITLVIDSTTLYIPVWQ